MRRRTAPSCFRQCEQRPQMRAGNISPATLLVVALFCVSLADDVTVLEMNKEYFFNITADPNLLYFRVTVDPSVIQPSTVMGEANLVVVVKSEPDVIATLYGRFGGKPEPLPEQHDFNDGKPSPDPSDITRGVWSVSVSPCALESGEYFFSVEPRMPGKKTPTLSSIKALLAPVALAAGSSQTGVTFTSNIRYHRFDVVETDKELEVVVDVLSRVAFGTTHSTTPQGVYVAYDTCPMSAMPYGHAGVASLYHVRVPRGNVRKGPWMIGVSAGEEETMEYVVRVELSKGEMAEGALYVIMLCIMIVIITCFYAVYNRVRAENKKRNPYNDLETDDTLATDGVVVRELTTFESGLADDRAEYLRAVESKEQRVDRGHSDPAMEISSS